MKDLIIKRLKNISPLTVVFFMAAVLACVIAAVHENAHVARRHGELLAGTLDARHVHPVPRLFGR